MERVIKMGKFTLDDGKIKQIAEKFNVTEETVQKVNTIYQEIDKEVKRQYLAHIVRAVEERVRIEQNNKTFSIKCKARDENASLPTFGVGQYLKAKNRYVIYYHPSQEPRQLRAIIAHELGHLIFRIMGSKYNLKETEPVSSIFGVIAILEKNRFYEELTQPYQYLTWEDLLADFVLLQKTSLGKYNIS